MTQTELVQDSPMFACGIRCAERHATARAENVADIIDTMGSVETFDYATYTRVAKAWKKGYKTVDGNPDGRTDDAANLAWGRIFKEAYGFTPSALKPKSGSASAQRKAEQRSAAKSQTASTTTDADADDTEDNPEPITLTPEETSFIIALRAKNLAAKDYARILATL